MAAPTLTPTGIRTDIVTRLTGKTAAGARVYDSRRIGIDPTEVPAITVYSAGWNESDRSLGGLVFERTETIGISGVVAAATDPALAAAADLLTHQILSALYTDLEWISEGAVLGKVTVDQPDLDYIEKNKRLGIISIKLELTYQTDYTVDLTGMDLESIAVTTEGADYSDPDHPVDTGQDVSERVIELETED